ncbi:MAG: hypothetical protein HOL48_06425 [Porticoccaceae bacterium]|jgi:hypothetical protein|nr:hypothetical protein [Porticoccaceae bacterium]
MQKRYIKLIDLVCLTRSSRSQAFLLSLLLVFGTLSVSSHVHTLDLHADAEVQTSHEVLTSLEELLAGECDHFHSNTHFVADTSVVSHHYSNGRETGPTEDLSTDSISPELFPPARAPPSIISLT